MKAIFLTGFMGAGKTTIGKLLGEYLQVPVIDTDEQIEKKMGQSIPKIFAEKGEAFFRKIESQCLQQMPTKDVIITTGGGIVIKDENRQWMKENGIVIFLDCDLDVLYERIQQDSNRPLANKKTKAEIIHLFQQRERFYKEADFQIVTTYLTPNEVVWKIVDCLKAQQLGKNS